MRTGTSLNIDKSKQDAKPQQTPHAAIPRNLPGAFDV